MYDYAVANGLDPLFLLAMFKHESDYGTAGTARETHSWGNTRLPIVGPTRPVYIVDKVPALVAGRSGQFPKWANWLDGGRSTVDRLVSTVYPEEGPYGARTIHAIFDHPSGKVWAPAGDLNSPTGYLRAVLDYMNQKQETTPVGNPLAKLTTYQDFLPYDMPNHPKQKLRGGVANYITIHEVGNLSKSGGTALATRNFVHNGGGEHEVSFHAVVGDTESYQLLPWDSVAWHAGDGGGDGNYDSIAIETQQVGNWEQTLRNLAVLTAKLMREFSIPLSHVVMHNHWSGKNCPQYIRAGVAPITGKPSWNWVRLREEIAAEYRKSDLSRVEDSVVAKYVDTPGQGVHWGVNEQGEPFLVVKPGGKMKPGTVNVNIQDLGFSGEGMNGLPHDISIRDNKWGAYSTRPK